MYSCAIDNGGCGEEEQCTEVANPICNPGECCSNVTITCTGKHVAICTSYVHNNYHDCYAYK